MQPLVCLTLLLAIVAATSATTCYECSTAIGESCGDEFAASSDYETDCSATGISSDEDGSCYKDKNKTKIFGVWITTVTRGCSGKNDNTACAQTDRISINIFGIKTETWACSCDGDKCNGGSQLALSTAALVLPIIVKFIS